MPELTSTISQYPLSNDPARAAAPRGPATGEALLAIEETLKRLRAELDATEDRARRARLLAEIAELEERVGDDAAAARDDLAAFNASPAYREPLEALHRLLERRRSLKNLVRVVDTMVRTAQPGDEKGRALLLQAALLDDESADPQGARAALRDALSGELRGAEASTAWLYDEIAAARLGDALGRRTALAERARRAEHPGWRALLLIDAAHLAFDAGEHDAAFAMLDEARALDSSVMFTAIETTCDLAERAIASADGDERSASLRVLEAARTGIAEALERARNDAAYGDAVGVPVSMRVPARTADAWLRVADARFALGDDAHARDALSRAQAAFRGTREADFGSVPGADGDAEGASSLALVRAELRAAERAKETSRAEELAREGLPLAGKGLNAAALAFRVAVAALRRGDGEGAHVAAAKAAAAAPASLVARALELELLRTADPARFAAELETLADALATDDARGRLFLHAAYAWAVSASDQVGAKTALSQAAMCGVRPATVARLSRALAAVTANAAWLEDGARRLLAAGAPPNEAVALWFELARARRARGDANGAARALDELSQLDPGAWLGAALKGYARAGSANPDEAAAGGVSALDALVLRSAHPDVAHGLRIAAALRALGASPEASAEAPREAPEARADGETTRRLDELLEADARDVLAAALRASLAARAGDAKTRVAVLERCADATDEEALRETLRLEAALARYRAGDREAAVSLFDAAATNAGPAARAALAWAARGGAKNSDDARRALDYAMAAGEHEGLLALERFGHAVIAGDAEDAITALARVEVDGDESLALAGSLGRILWARAGVVRADVDAALARIAAVGPEGARLSSAERVRLARESGDANEWIQAARDWFAIEGGLAPALEWLAAATADGDESARADALEALAVAFAAAPADVTAGVTAGVTDGWPGATPEGVGSNDGADLSADSARDPRGPSGATAAAEALLAAAALLRARGPAREGARMPFLDGRSHAVRLANLELAPPGSDPRRRAAALSEVDGALGPEGELDALALAGWSYMATGAYVAARAAFERATEGRPDDLSAWEGLRVASMAVSEFATAARACEALGARCRDDARAAAFWESAALLWLDLGEGERGELALDESFARDASRSVAFDKLFRRVRERKDGDKLLAIIQQRLEATDDPPEIAKLFWEQARVLRERGDQDGALKALENVTMLEPDHVGALALTGEIFIRRGMFEEAAESLSRLSLLEEAPPKNRVTAGVAAVDLYENKLNRFDKALEILLALHRAKLSTLPVRERLARAAARTGSWKEAVAILEELMHERAEVEARVEAARLAMAIHRDRLARPEDAFRAVRKLLDESPTDGEAIEMLLAVEPDAAKRERYLLAARDRLTELLRVRPFDVALSKRLAKVARALGHDGVQQVALSLVIVANGGDAQTEQAFAQLAAKKGRVPQIRLSPLQLTSIVAEGDGGPLADLFALLAPTLAEAFGPSLAGNNVSRRDKVDPRSGLALRNEVSAWAGAFGIGELDLYIGGKDPLGVFGVPGETPSLVLGPGLNAPLTPVARARVAAELFALVRGTSIVRHRDATGVATILTAACRIAEVPIAAPPYATLAEVERSIARAVPRRVRKLLPDACRAVVAAAAEPVAFARSAALSHARAAVIAAGDVNVVLGDMLGVTAEPLASAARGDARAEGLIRFVLSPDYLELRRALGLEGAS
jgi:lipopolysaccharide biosynthesis regulator YciM